MALPFSRAVERTRDFERIVRLPRRVGDIAPSTLADEMTSALRTPSGSWRLREVQARSLYEAMACKGLFAPMGVGTGKTLVTLLLPIVLDAKRPILVLPASLVEKTEGERRELMRHWRVATHLRIVSYEMLGRENAANWVELARPDLIIADECHKLKNRKAAVTRRVDRWMTDHPETVFAGLSGTICKASLRDFAHLLRWALGEDGAPIPRLYGELSDWADALDERVNPLQRVRPGALLHLADIRGAESELAAARLAFRDRLTSTPAVVASLNAEAVDCSIYLEGHVLEANSATEENFRTLRTKWETPDGWALSEAVDVWRHARELALGLHYVWEPRPPEEWLAARRAWAAWVREILSESRTLDTEKQVRNAVIAGDLDDGGLWHDWERIKPTFQITSKAVWHDETALEHCEKWLRKEKGIAWTEHTFFARELARRTGLPYYGQNATNDRGEAIREAKGPIIASIAACGTGQNLQRYSRNLVVSLPTGASVWEQLIGRTHRPGQEADEVLVDMLFGCAEHVAAWERAQAEARMASDMLGQPQKILFADVVLPEFPRFGTRWEKTKGESQKRS